MHIAILATGVLLSPMVALAGEGDGFTVSDTTFKMGGFIDFDAQSITLNGGAFSSTSIARDFLIPGATPIGGDRSSTSDYSAESSRLFFSGSRTIDYGAGEATAIGYIEIDFLGSGQGNERVSNSYSPRLRRAFVDLSEGQIGIRYGQEWSTFQNTSSIPESASFLTLPDGMIFVRQALMRLTYGNFQLAFENSVSTIYGEADHPVDEAFNFPDAVLRYNIKGDFGNISLAGLVREIRNDIGTENKTTIGWGASLSGRLKIFASDDIRFGGSYGAGLGRYIGLNTARAAATNPNGDLEAITSYGGHVAWRHSFSKTSRNWHTSVGASTLIINVPDYLPDNTTNRVWSVYAGVFCDLFRDGKFTYGLQIEYGQREIKAAATDTIPNTGNIFRTTFSVRYGF